MVDEMINEKDLISMKLLHYFITKKNYNPIIVQGVENEIWLENLDEDYKVVRIVSNYIHNDEQLGFDAFKTQRMIQKIKRKTFTLHINVLTFLVDVGENVDRTKKFNNIDFIYAEKESDLEKSDLLKNALPDLFENLNYSEEGFQLFIKITDEINEKNKKTNEVNENIFKPKKIIVTYIIIGLLVAIYLFATIFQKQDYLVNYFSTFGPYIRQYHEYYRLLTGTLIHVDFFHILCNCYSLYIIGTQIENFFGKRKFLFIYLVSALTGSLLSICMNNAASIGASGAIFGLAGSMIYFGYHYRVYLGSVLKSRIIPIVILNLLIGFTTTGIDNFAHIGGLIGGILASMAVGINDNKESNRTNGIILLAIFVIFLVYLGIFVK